MGRVRSAAVAALAGSLIFIAGAPALAADGDSLAVVSTGLTEGQVVGGKYIFYPVVTGDHITKIDLVINGSLVHSYTSMPAHMVLPFSSLVQWPDEVPVTIRLADAAGDTAEATTDVRPDTVLPQATFSPAGGTTLRGSSVTVTPVTISDDVAEVDLLSLQDGHVISAATEAPWSLTYPLSGGSVHLLVRVVDKATNQQGYDLVYKVDNSGPHIDIYWPSTPGVVRGGKNPGLYALASDPSGVDRVEWWIGAVQIPGIADYDFGTVSRTVAMQVRAFDRLGNETITPLTVRIDAGPPSVRSITALPGASLHGAPPGFAGRR